MFPLELKGLTASLNEAATSSTATSPGERARTPHGFMTDANVDARSGVAPMSRRVTYALIPHKNGLALEVRLDRAWRDDPARVYPLIVDPGNQTGAGGGDTCVSATYPTSNYSYESALNIGTYNSGVDQSRRYVRFDTTPLRRSRVVGRHGHGRAVLVRGRPENGGNPP